MGPIIKVSSAQEQKRVRKDMDEILSSSQKRLHLEEIEGKKQ